MEENTYRERSYFSLTSECYLLWIEAEKAFSPETIAGGGSAYAELCAYVGEGFGRV